MTEPTQEIRTSESLDELVVQFQAAKERNDNTSVDFLCRKIDSHCAHLISSIRQKWYGLRLFIEDISNSKLYGCLCAFNPDDGGSFQGYFRQSLNNAVLDELRRRKRSKTKQSEEIDNVASSNFDTVEFNDEIESKFESYARNKREILDKLDRMTRNRMATLLLDQRQRMARLYESLDYYRVKQTSTSRWLETVEIWRADDPLIPVQTNEATVGQVWDIYSKMLDEDGQRVLQSDMVEAIAKSGSPVSDASWRQRVSRYLRDVREQLDEASQQYFRRAI